VVGRPPVLLADEPTGNLDPHLSREIVELFVRFNQVGGTLLIATHDVDIIRSMGKRVLVLDQGELTHDLPAGALNQ
jgi:cell division transport system ATP-binding protein